MVTQTIHVGDCELLEHYFDVTDRDNPKWRDPEDASSHSGAQRPNFPKNLDSGDTAQWNFLYGIYQQLGYRCRSATRRHLRRRSPNAGGRGSASRRSS